MTLDKENDYTDKLICSAIDSMETSNWEWPKGWTSTQKNYFLKECLNWLETNQEYERCQIILNVQKEL
jgi:hypothetical protein